MSLADTNFDLLVAAHLSNSARNNLHSLAKTKWPDIYGELRDCALHVMHDGTLAPRTKSKRTNQLRKYTRQIILLAQMLEISLVCGVTDKREVDNLDPQAIRAVGMTVARRFPRLTLVADYAQSIIETKELGTGNIRSVEAAARNWFYSFSAADITLRRDRTIGTLIHKVLKLYDSEFLYKSPAAFGIVHDTLESEPLDKFISHCSTMYHVNSRLPKALGHNVVMERLGLTLHTLSPPFLPLFAAHCRNQIASGNSRYPEELVSFLSEASDQISDLMIPPRAST